MPTYTFTEDEARAAYDAWGCNCGPSALAFALQCSLDKVRPLIPDFEAKRYTSPTMMRTALETVGRNFIDVRPKPRTAGGGLDIEPMFCHLMSLVRIQWTGPWTAPNANPKWAYRQTHWIATWTERNVALIFDINGGVRGPQSWEEEIVPMILEGIPRADGSWYPTHIWRLKGTPTWPGPDLVKR